MDSVELAGRGALVTGAAGAVGRAVVERLQAEGYVVAGLDFETGAGDLSLAVDVTDRRQVEAAVAGASAKLGPISVLVTAQGQHSGAPFGTMSRVEWQRLLDTYLGGTVNACAAVVPGMVRAGRGIVITSSSWLALAGVPGEAYMAAATGTILAFTKSFSLEVAPKGVRVNCIAWGPLEDESMSPGFRGQWPQAETLPIGRYVRPSDIADTVSFLLRDGDFFVGQVLCPTGGAVV
jgi:2-hydroxycyclohexanecarboxyl-CoA dehydrogenase